MRGSEVMRGFQASSLAVLSLLASWSAVVAAAERPNVVIIMADDLGWGSVGCYGADPALVQTPHIDRLAREGRRFTDGNTPSSVCSPTRYALLTGRYCWRTSLKSEVLQTTAPLHIEPGRLTIASLLKSQGYRTAAIGKWHLGYGSAERCDYTRELKPGPLEIGFDHHFAVPQNHGDASGVYVEDHWVLGLDRASPAAPSPPYATEAIRKGRPFRTLALNAPKRIDEEVMATLTDRAVEWIGRQQAGTPFFLSFTPVAVHDPITPSARTAGKSKGGPFCDFIHDLDDSVGRVLEALDRHGFTRDTLVLFTSDNGGANKPGGDTPPNRARDAGLKPVGPFRGGKHDVWDGGFRVPYIVRWPGHVPAGTACDEPVGVVDTLATLAAVTGAALPDAAVAAEDSHDVSAAWLGRPHASPLRPDLILHSADGNFAIRRDGWKWIEGVPAEGVSPGSLKARAEQFQPMLFRVADDVAEANEVSAAHPAIAADLKARLDRHRTAGSTRGPQPANRVDAEVDVEKPQPAAVTLTLQAPLEHQVVQRTSPGQGLVRIVGELSEDCPPAATIEARLVDAGAEPAWQTVGGVVKNRKFTAAFQAPAGGWRRLDVRLMHDRREVARGSVAEVGIGEVFVVAGQSNSANHGAEKQETKTGRVATFDGKAWRLAHDPQPGASGGGGSFMPPLGDALVERFGVPVGFVACGIGATSVREWLPKGATFANPPTIEGRVVRLPDGGWASKGDAYDGFVARMKSLGPRGFRAVLWHQGESDANQKDPSRTLPGNLYREYLERLIRDSRQAIGWDAPWFVAQASYHVPGDEGSDDIRAAQAALWRDGVAFEGPDSDALKGPLREGNGRGVHFSGPGLRAHAAAWAEKVGPWIDREWTAPRRADGGTEWTRYEPLPLSHSLGWVSRNVTAKDTSGWNGVLDEAKWGTPSPEQVVARNWDWKIGDEQWREAVKAAGDGPREEVRFDLWVPDGVEVVKGVVVMSGHGSGENLFKRPDLRALARELGLAVFKFVGNPLQRGFWPRSLLFERLQALGEASGHPELARAPLFLYGHSNGTGFSAVFAANEPERVWGWVSMRPGITFQVFQPGAARVPGLVIFGEDDPFLARPSREENLAVVPAVRRRHDAVWNMAVEPQTGHGPGEKTWPLVFSFLRHTFTARVPADADPRRGPVPLRALAIEGGQLGENWNAAKGGFQSLRTAAYADFPGDRSTASWLVNPAYAADWQAFQRDGEIKRPE